MSSMASSTRPPTWIRTPGRRKTSINQAMMHGLPVICGPADGTERDLLTGGELVGRLLPSVTPDALAEAVSHLAGKDLKAIGESARRRIAAGFTLDHQVRAMAGLVAAVMARGRC